MATTNGFDATRVLAALSTRLGWKQPTESDYAIVDAGNLVSTSGRFFNGGAFHSALTIENIHDCQPNPSITPTQFNTLLTERKNEMILSALNSVFDKPQFIESGLLYEKQGHNTRTAINNNDSFCGVRVKVSPGDYAVTIDTAELLFDGAKTFNLYLFHDKKGLVSTQSVTVAANTLLTVTLGWTLNYRSATVRGGHYYIGYFQNDLGNVKAIDYDFHKTCSSITYGAQSFISPRTAPLTYNADNISYSNSMFGLNLEISGYRDLTQDIVNNAHLFDELQGLMMAYNALQLIIHSTRSNESKRITQANIEKWTTDITGLKTEEGQYIPSFPSRIAKEIEKVRKAFQPKKNPIVVTSPIWKG